MTSHKPLPPPDRGGYRFSKHIIICFALVVVVVFFLVAHYAKIDKQKFKKELKNYQCVYYSHYLRCTRYVRRKL